MEMLNLSRICINIMITVCLSISTFSCNDETDIYSSDSNATQDIEVSKMGDWLPGTRNASGISSDMPVLRFKNEQIYLQTIEKLNKMTLEERETYFKKIGFDGAYTLWKQADEELDRIFDNEDTLQLEKLIADYKIKYDHIFSFNSINTYDITPYFTFTDNELSLIGNIKGYVVIGNVLKAPKKNSPLYKVDAVAASTRASGAVMDQSDFIGFQNASLTINNGNYRSTMTIGRMAKGRFLAVAFNTKKKAALYIKNATTNYSADLALHSAKVPRSRNKIVCPYGNELFVMDLKIETIGNIFDAEAHNFKCSFGENVGKHSFNDIQVL